MLFLIQAFELGCKRIGRKSYMTFIIYLLLTNNEYKLSGENEYWYRSNIRETNTIMNHQKIQSSLILTQIKICTFDFTYRNIEKELPNINNLSELFTKKWVNYALSFQELTIYNDLERLYLAVLRIWIRIWHLLFL